jgi:DHA1 family tetracycline resistance protein-like MFS transporter
MDVRARCTDDPPRVTPRPAALRFVFLVVLLDLLGIGLLIPVGPRLVMDLQGGGEQDAAPVVGWLGAVYSVMIFLCAPLLGALSDRFGRRPVLLLSMLGTGLDYFAMALAPSLAWLFVTRVVNGLTGASVTTAAAYIADVTPPERRAAGYGVFGAAASLGFVLGPLLGGYLGQFDLRLPFWIAGALALGNALYGALVLPESLPPERRTRRPVGSPFAALAILRQQALVRRLSLTLFCAHMAQFALHSTWVLYTRHRYGWDSAAVGWSMFAVGIGGAIVQGGLARRIVPALGERRSLLLGLSLGIVAYVGYGSATAGWMLYVAIAVASLGGITMPACQAMITKSVRPDQQGLVQGGLTSLQSLATIAGYPAGAYVFQASIDGAHPALQPGSVYFMSALLCAVGLLLAAWNLRPAPARP